jgi:uncharacterized heparinase superfamily protein
VEPQNDRVSSEKQRLPRSSRLHRWAYLVRYHRPRQLLARAVKLTRWCLAHWLPARNVRNSVELPPLRANAALKRVLELKRADRLSTERFSSVDRIRKGVLRFLNEERRVGIPPDWRLTEHDDVDNLWHFHLHSHEFLLDLEAAAYQTGDTTLFEIIWSIVRHWIEENPPHVASARNDAWHPFCISQRLSVWVLLWQTETVPSSLRTKVLESIVVQVSELERNLEVDLGGNHLLENARALGVVGAFFAGKKADTWLALCLRILKRELPRQILRHGEHFERSPMYHCHVLDALLDLKDVAHVESSGVALTCNEWISAMASFLARIRHPDGGVPLLSDTVTVDSPSCDNLLKRAEILPLREPTTGCHGPEQIGGYWVWREDTNFLIFDAADAYAGELPGHAHADLLTLEASVDGERLFVDTGVYDYGDTPMRGYCRSTAAHNVLEVDGIDQFDMWSRFRMGYRGWPGELRKGSSDGCYWATTTHNAYRRVSVAAVGRWLGCFEGGPWVCVDWAYGAGHHQLTWRLHLHPSVNAKLMDDCHVELRTSTRKLVLMILGRWQARLAQGWYCPRFGVREPSMVIEANVTAPLPVLGGWCLCHGDVADCREDDFRLAKLSSGGGWQLGLDLRNERHIWDCAWV